MPQEWHSHDLAYEGSFESRRPVLDGIAGLRGRWRLSEGGRRLETDLPLSSYSPHERAVIEFAIDPYYMAGNIFAGLDQPARWALAKAIHDFFGQGGAADAEQGKPAAR
jgi:hypothetical protein